MGTIYKGGIAYGGGSSSQAEPSGNSIIKLSNISTDVGSLDGQIGLLVSEMSLYLWNASTNSWNHIGYLPTISLGSSYVQLPYYGNGDSTLSETISDMKITNISDGLYDANLGQLFNTQYTFVVDSDSYLWGPVYLPTGTLVKLFSDGNDGYYVGEAIVPNDADGYFTNDLQPGTYRVTLNARDDFDSSKPIWMRACIYDSKGYQCLFSSNTHLGLYHIPAYTFRVEQKCLDSDDNYTLRTEADFSSTGEILDCRLYDGGFATGEAAKFLDNFARYKEKSTNNPLFSIRRKGDSFCTIWFFGEDISYTLPSDAISSGSADRVTSRSNGDCLVPIHYFGNPFKDTVDADDNLFYKNGEGDSTMMYGKVTGTLYLVLQILNRESSYITPIFYRQYGQGIGSHDSGNDGYLQSHCYLELVVSVANASDSEPVLGYEVIKFGYPSKHLVTDIYGYGVYIGSSGVVTRAIEDSLQANYQDDTLIYFNNIVWF